MRNISGNEFVRICEENQFKEYIFDTNNQPSWESDDVREVTIYEELLVSAGINRVCFKNRCGTRCFTRVKYAFYEYKSDSVSHIFTIICGNQLDENADKAYVILAR